MCTMSGSIVREKRHFTSNCIEAVYEVVHDTLSRFSRAVLMPVFLLLLFTLAAPWGCDREPGIIVNIAACPDGVDIIHVRTSIEGTLGTDIFLNKDQTRFAVRVPAGSQGTVHLDVTGFDAGVCKLATGVIDEPVPSNFSQFAERTLEFSPLPARLCNFATFNEFPVGRRPFSVAVGDFNGDMNPDLAVAINSTDQVSVLLGTGMGGFGMAATFALGSGMGPNSVAVGDFNGDMNHDLAVLSFKSGDVSLLLGDGASRFATATNFLVGHGPNSMAVGNFNRDRNLDLVVANNNDNNVAVLLGNDKGAFGEAIGFPIGMGPQPVAVAVGDFNGDMNPDLAVAKSTSNNVTVLFGNGIGNFGAAKDFSVGMYPGAVAVGDFNGDMKPDLAVANSTSQDVSVLLGDGMGGFRITTFPVLMSPGPLAVGDFNGDKKIDLVVLNNSSDGNYVSVLLGDGTGGFRPGGNFVVGTVPVSVAVGDFNGDMKPDLAVANYLSDSVTILLNKF